MPATGQRCLNSHGRKTIPAILCMYSTLSSLASRGEKKKSRVGKGTSEQTRRISPRNGIPQTTSAGLCLGPLAKSPHNDRGTRTTPSRRAMEKVGNSRRWLPPSIRPRLHRSGRGQPWGLFWYMTVNHEIVGIVNSTNKLDACLASAPDDPCLTLSLLVPCDVRSRHKL